MELSSEILESLVIDNKDVMEVLKDGNVTEEDIIFESEATEDSEEAEIEEIIEIIEEVEEESDEIPLDDTSNKDKSVDAKETGIEKTKKNDKVTSKNIELYSFDEENSMFTSQLKKESNKNSTVKNSTQKTAKKQIINYDVDEDWQDEELERIDGLDNNSELMDNRMSSSRMQAEKHVNNQTTLLQSNKLDLKIHMDSMGKADKSRMDGNKVNNTEDDSESTQEIVKNTENNLLYTVLGTKKPDSSTKQQLDKLTDHYVKVSISDENIKNSLNINE